MTARAQTKIFGIRVGIDPKILAGVLIVLAAALLWYNNRSDDDVPPTVTAARRDIPAATPSIRAAGTPRPRRSQMANDRGGLRLRPIDPTRGDVDPTLRLDLLARLQNVQLATPARSLFEPGPAPLTPEQEAILKNPPKVPPKAPAPPLNPGPIVPVEQPLNIPLKYYGFVKPAQQNEGNAGLFLDGDNVVVGSEGEVVMKRYLIVALTPTTARLEDTQLKKGQTLTVVPAATP